MVTNGETEQDMFTEFTKIEKTIMFLLLFVSLFLPEEQNENIKKAGISLVVGVITVAAFAGAAAFAFLQKPPQQDQAQPQAVDSFGITQAKENTVVPLLYGLNRVPGNILFYGNLETKEIYQKVKSGKGGGGSSKQLVGYEYRLDVWQSIGQTSPGASYIELLATYVDDELSEPEASEEIYNNGTTNDFPDFSNTAGKLPNVAHIGYRKLFLGENRTQLQVIHFVTRTVLATGLPNENTSEGNNPAAVIYDLLLLSKKVKPNQIDWDSFVTAANYWHSVGYTCSMKQDKIDDVYEVINRILVVFPGVLYPNGEDKLVLKAFDPTEAASWVIGHQDHKNISFKRQAYPNLPNDFGAKYQDKDLDYSERHVGASNDAVVELTGERKIANYDFSLVRTSATASRLIDERMKKESYPRAFLTFSTNLDFLGVNPGDVIDYSNDRLGIVSMFIRVNSVTKPAIGSNEVKIEAEQMVERLFDNVFVDTFESVSSGIGELLPAVEIRDVLEIPYNNITGFQRRIFCIVERLNGFETGFDIGYSPTRTPTAPATELEYTTLQRFLSFSLRGELTEDYNFSTFFDNSVLGLEFQPDITYYPEFDNEQLDASYINNTRYILIGSELMTFATITPLGGGEFRINGLKRGVFGSRVRTNYPTGTKIIIFNVLDNVFDENIKLANFSKIQATGLFTTKQQLAPLDEFETMNDQHATMVGIPCYFEVVKTGTNLDFRVFPTVNANNGFGSGTPNTCLPRSTRSMPPNGKIRVFYNKNTTTYNDYTTVDFSDTAPTSDAVEINLQVIEVRDGVENRSQYVTFNIGASDGTYKFNSLSKWSRKLYNVSGEWIPTYIGDKLSE